MNNSVTYKDVFNGIFKPLDLVIEQADPDLKPAIERLKNLEPFIFDNGQLKDGQLNPDYAEKTLSSDTLKQAFEDAGLKGCLELYYLKSYCTFELFKNKERFEGIKKEAYPILEKIINTINQPQ